MSHDNEADHTGHGCDFDPILIEQVAESLVELAIARYKSGAIPLPESMAKIGIIDAVLRKVASSGRERDFILMHTGWVLAEYSHLTE